MTLSTGPTLDTTFTTSRTRGFVKLKHPAKKQSQKFAIVFSFVFDCFILSDVFLFCTEP